MQFEMLEYQKLSDKLLIEHGITSMHLKKHVEHFNLEKDQEIEDYKKALLEAEIKKQQDFIKSVTPSEE